MVKPMSLQARQELLTNEVRTKLLSISPATFDRMLKKERTKVKGSVTTTKPGSLLKRQIKVRTFADWNEQTPGFFEIDLVAHGGKTVHYRDELMSISLEKILGKKAIRN